MAIELLGFDLLALLLLGAFWGIVSAAEDHNALSTSEAVNCSNSASPDCCNSCTRHKYRV
jgi:hypothetical protein